MENYYALKTDCCCVSFYNIVGSHFLAHNMHGSIANLKSGRVTLLRKRNGLELPHRQRGPNSGLVFKLMHDEREKIDQVISLRRASKEELKEPAHNTSGQRAAVPAATRGSQ